MNKVFSNEYSFFTEDSNIKIRQSARKVCEYIRSRPFPQKVERFNRIALLLYAFSCIQNLVCHVF